MVCVEHILVVMSLTVVSTRGAESIRSHRVTLIPSYNEIRPTRELCEDLNPPGYRYPQKTRSPYVVTVTWDEVPDLTIFVDSPHSLSFEGLIVQVRSDVSKEPIGVMNGYGSQAPINPISCYHTEDTAYIASRRWRQSEVVYWFAPQGFNRSDHPLTLVATVIFGPYVFWQHEVSIPLCLEHPYIYNENEPNVGPVRKKKFKAYRMWNE